MARDHDAEKAFYDRIGSGYDRALFATMMERADHDSAYAGELAVWLKRGSTLRLRDLVKPFGDYWRNLDFANVVDSLDSLRAKA